MKRIIAMIICALMLLSLAACSVHVAVNSTESTEQVTVNSIESPDVQTPTEIAETVGETPAVSSVDSDDSQAKALEAAKVFLNNDKEVNTGCSYNKMVERVESKGFSHEDAVYAADNCGADWEEQALLCAQNIKKNLGDKAVTSSDIITIMTSDAYEFSYDRAAIAAEQVAP